MIQPTNVGGDAGIWNFSRLQISAKVGNHSLVCAGTDDFEGMQVVLCCNQRLVVALGGRQRWKKDQ